MQPRRARAPTLTREGPRRGPPSTHRGRSTTAAGGSRGRSRRAQGRALASANDRPASGHVHRTRAFEGQVLTTARDDAEDDASGTEPGGCRAAEIVRLRGPVAREVLVEIAGSPQIDVVGVQLVCNRCRKCASACARQRSSSPAVGPSSRTRASSSAIDRSTSASVRPGAAVATI